MLVKLFSPKLVLLAIVRGSFCVHTLFVLPWILCAVKLYLFIARLRNLGEGRSPECRKRLQEIGLLYFYLLFKKIIIIIHCTFPSVKLSGF